MPAFERPVIAAIAVALAVSLGVGGCGRRGPPEPPGAPEAPDFLDDDAPITGRAPVEDEAAPRRRFILDPLVE